MCGENVNEEGRGGDAATAGLIQKLSAPDWPSLPHNEVRKRHGPHVRRCVDANLVKCLLVMQLGKKMPNQESATRAALGLVVAGFVRTDKLGCSQI